MSPRRTLHETRVLVLDAGTDLLLSGDEIGTVAAVSLIDACRHAGLSTAGSGYKIWPTQDEFRLDLLRHALHSTSNSAETAEAIQNETANGDTTRSLRDLIRLVGADNAARNLASPTAKLYPALWYAAHRDDLLAEQIHDTDRRLITEMAELYRATIPAYGREWVPPFDAMMLATLLASLVEGLTMRATFAPELVPTALDRPTGPDGAIEQWHLFACGVEALIDLCSRPVRDDS